MGAPIACRPPRREGGSTEPMAVDVERVSELDVEPGQLPDTMAAWVIREEREGEPTEAFQLEEIEVPEPGAFEDRKSTRLNSSHANISYAVFCLKKKHLTAEPETTNIRFEAPTQPPSSPRPVHLRLV